MPRIVPSSFSFALALVLAPTLAACRSGSSAEPDAAPSASPTAMQRVTAADCDQWADHGADVIVKAFRDAAHDCPQKVRDDVRAKFEDQRSSLRDGAKALCSRHLDETYRAADGACFLAATNAPDLAACKLAPMTNRDDSDWVQITLDLKKKCAAPSVPSSAASGTTL